MKSTSQLLKALGLGCGEDCVCREIFAAKLSPDMKELFGHLVERGVEEGTIKDGLSQVGEEEDGPQSLTAFLVQMMVAGAAGAFTEPELYEGDLNDDQKAALAEVSEEDRGKAERELRAMIARIGGDPNKAILDIEDDKYRIVGAEEKMVYTDPRYDTNVAPYVGELSTRLLAQLEKVVASARPMAEQQLREAISVGGGDQDQVYLAVGQGGTEIMVASVNPESLERLSESDLRRLPGEALEVVQILKAKRAEADARTPGVPHEDSPWHGKSGDQAVSA